MLRPLTNKYNEFQLDVAVQKNRTEQAENNILEIMNKKKANILSVEEYLHGKSDNERLFFLGNLKYFSKISRIYLRENGHIISYLKINR